MRAVSIRDTPVGLLRTEVAPGLFIGMIEIHTGGVSS